MKKPACLLLAALLLLPVLTGCGEKQPVPFAAENEIATYTNVDPEKTQLSVSSLGNNANIRGLAKAFEAQNPDVQIICLDLTGGTVDYSPAVADLEHGMTPDIMFVNYNTFSLDTFTNDVQIIELMTDLSTEPVIECFEAEALNRVAVEGRVFFLPAPSEVNCIMYNKTLFDQYGWEVPKTFDEFVDLCVQISEDTGGAVQPWNPNAKYDSVFSVAIEAFIYEELFGGKDNRIWYNEFCNGEATFAGHMEPMYEVLQSLVDNDILKEEHFSYSATARGKEFQDGLIAMYNAPISNMNSDKYEFGYMPYPTTKGELGYVNDAFSSMLCVPKKEHTDAQRDAIRRFLEFYSSAEGQQALISESLMVSNVKGVPLNDTAAMAGIEEVIAQGRQFSRLDFPGPGARTWSIRDNALAMAAEGKTGDEIIAEIDAHPYKTADESETITSEKLADVAEDFSSLEFSSFIADMYRETAEADIALINHGVAYRGNLVRLYAGELYDSYMYPLRPRSFANDSTLIKVSMTGRQILDALNHPVGNECVSNSIYAFSGLKCEVAPWNELGSKYLSVKLMDGSELEKDRLYTVAVWAGTIADEYITETLETYEGIWDELMAAYLSAAGTIAPAKDGRITLVYSE